MSQTPVTRRIETRTVITNCDADGNEISHQLLSRQRTTAYIPPSGGHARGRGRGSGRGYHPSSGGRGYHPSSDGRTYAHERDPQPYSNAHEPQQQQQQPLSVYASGPQQQLSVYDQQQQLPVVATQQQQIAYASGLQQQQGQSFVFVNGQLPPPYPMYPMYQSVFQPPVSHPYNHNVATCNAMVPIETTQGRNANFYINNSRN